MENGTRGAQGRRGDDVRQAHHRSEHLNDWEAQVMKSHTGQRPPNLGIPLTASLQDD